MAQIDPIQKGYHQQSPKSAGNQNAKTVEQILQGKGIIFSFHL